MHGLTNKIFSHGLVVPGFCARVTLPLAKIKNNVPQSSGLARRKSIYFSLIVVQLEYRKSMHSSYPLTHQKQVNFLKLILQNIIKKTFVLLKLSQSNSTIFLNFSFFFYSSLSQSGHPPTPTHLSKSRHLRILPRNSKKQRIAWGLSAMKLPHSKSISVDFLGCVSWNTLQQTIKCNCPRKKKVNGSNHNDRSKEA